MTEKKQQIRDYLAITVGTILIAFAIKNIFDPVSMVTGGVSGAAIILKELWQVPLWLTNTVLNIPLFLAAFRMMGWQFIGRTLYSTAMLSAALYVLPEMGLVKEDMILSALFGGVLSGVGTGLVFLGGCTTGGTDMLAVLIRGGLRHYSSAQIMQVLDGGIVAAGALVFGIRPSLYAMIAIVCVSRVTDRLIEGMKFSKEAWDHFKTGQRDCGSGDGTPGKRSYQHKSSGYVFKRREKPAVLRGFSQGNCKNQVNCA